MSTFDIKMPKLGESITEGTIILWSVKEGNIIEEDQILFEVATQKVTEEIPSPVSGKIKKILVKEGETAPVGTVVAIIQLDEDVIEDTVEDSDNKSVETQTEEKNSLEITESVSSQQSSKQESERWYSPVVLKIAGENGISLKEMENIPGTGYMERLSKKDIENYIERKKKVMDTSTTGKSQIPQTDISPAKPLSESKQNATQPISSGHENDIIEMDSVGRLIADHMVMSKKVSPHVTTIVEADVTNLVRWRERIKDDFLKQEGIKLTFMPSITEASAKALKDFPQVNASVDGYKMILKKQINIGIAVALDNGNLVVPVIHNADKQNINGLALSIENLANKARKNKLTIEDIEGGTFTITNFGTFKNIIGTPIINQPQVAILGVGYVEKKPAVIETPEGDVIAIRHKMYLSLSYDHRIINGALGGAFLRRIADYLENIK